MRASWNNVSADFSTTKYHGKYLAYRFDNLNTFRLEVFERLLSAFLPAADVSLILCEGAQYVFDVGSPVKLQIGSASTFPVAGCRGCYSTLHIRRRKRTVCRSNIIKY